MKSISDHLEKAIFKMGQAIVDSVYGDNGPVIKIDAKSAMIVHEAAKAYLRERTLQKDTEAAIIAAHCRGELMKVRKDDYCTCKVPKLPVGFIHMPTRMDIICQTCGKEISRNKSYKEFSRSEEKPNAV